MQQVVVIPYFIYNMKQFKLLWAVAAATVLFSSCNGKKDDPVKPDVKQDVEIPGVIFESYYVGDYYETETSANVFMNFISGNVDLNEAQTDYIGDGQILCLDVNIALSSSVEEADHLTIPAGTYNVGDDTHAPLTWNPTDSYLIKVENDVVLVDQMEFKSGTIVVEKTEKGSKIVFHGVLKNDTEFSYEYEGVDRLMNHADDSKYSNLDKNIEVGNLAGAAYSSLGDVVGDGKTETWVISLADKYYDFESDYGNGESVMLYLNVAKGATEIPEGKITEFADLNVTESLEPNTFVAGLFMYGLYGGCWYRCPANAYEAAIMGGEVEIKKVDETKYSISGTLREAYGKTVTFSYEGEVAKMEYKEKN